jgi:sec-independent protein translocase protein TatA
MFGLGVPELIIILVIALIIFGPKRLPQLGESLGKTIRAIRKGSEAGPEDEEAGPAGDGSPKTPKSDDEE